MSKLSKIFSTVPIDIPNRSGKDLSHENIGSLPVGTLVPVLCEQVNPNETYDLGYLMKVVMPPLAANFFGRVDLRLEAFFVPNRIVWAGWKDFWTEPVNSPYDSLPPRPLSLPSYKVVVPPSSVDSFKTYFGKGTLTDCLGSKISGITAGTPSTSTTVVFNNLLPYLAYHKIFDDWYRNTMVQKPLFTSAGSNYLTLSPYRSNPWTAVIPSSDFNPTFTNSSFSSSPLYGTFLGDGVSVFSLRQRNYAKDYFTTASLYPDSANGSKVSFTSAVDSESGSAEGTISIASIRAANVLQRWLDRNNIAGFHYSDQIRAQFGILPSDAIMDRAIFLGSDKFGIYNTTVRQTSPTESGVGDKNPFRGSLGSSAGSADGQNTGQLINNFTATEHGYLFVLASVVPHAYYSSGTRRHLVMSRPSDFPIPLLQGLGEQAIYEWELSNSAPGTVLATDTSAAVDVPATSWSGKVFGYSPQYSWAKFHEDEVHGELRDDGTLSAFALKRSFDSGVTLNTSFIQIPTTALDEVFAYPEDGNFCWYDIYHNFKKVDTLSDYVLPTLGDLKNTHKEKVPFRGRQL